MSTSIEPPSTFRLEKIVWPNLQTFNSVSFPNGISNVSGTTAGLGTPAIRKEAITGVVTSSQASVVSLTPPATAGRYQVGGVITQTSGTNTGTVALEVTYTDSQGTTHTADVISLMKADGTIVQSGTGASTEWKGIISEISIDNSASAITVLTAVTGSVNYTVAGFISQVA